MTRSPVFVPLKSGLLCIVTPLVLTFPDLRSKSLKRSQAVPRFLYQLMVLIALGLALAKPALAQGFTVEGPTRPSVVEGGTFVSMQGRFTIALPQRTHGFKPLSFNTAAGRAVGDAYNWTMKEGSFIVGYVDAPQLLETPEMSKQVFAGIRNGMDNAAHSQNGRLISQRETGFDGHPALELKLEFPARISWHRYYLISRRLYQVQLVLQTEQRIYEDLAVKVLNSFKVLSDDEVSAAQRAKAAEAEPSPLPQAPVISRVSSDARDAALHGMVKTVFEEDEDRSGTWSVQGRKPNSMEYYNARGDLTRRESYDYKGNLSEITVFGYLDGARVSRRKSIQREYNPPPMIIASPSGTRPKSDPGYSNKFAFRYDEHKRLIEKTWFLNNGEVSIRYVYKYSENQREELVYSADGSLNQRYLSVLNEKGTEVERTSFEMKDGSIRAKYKYAYEFDAQGNWIKRSTSKWVTKDGTSYYEPAYVDYRTITYYKTD